MLDPTFSRERIKRLIAVAGERLTGDWLLVGGALAAIWFSDERVTDDVDLVAMSPRAEARRELMAFALEQGFPLEALNSAADFFVRRIDGWEDEVELLHAGRSARIFRPTPTLFLLLKSGRMSDADLADSLGLLVHAKLHGLAVDHARVVAYLESLPPAESEPAAARRRALRAALG